MAGDSSRSAFAFVIHSQRSWHEPRAGRIKIVNRTDIRYTRSGDVAIAYQVIGGETRDLVFVTGFVSNLAYAWEHPVRRALLRSDCGVLADDPLRPPRDRP